MAFSLPPNFSPWLSQFPRVIVRELFYRFILPTLRSLPTDFSLWMFQSCEFFNSHYLKCHFVFHTLPHFPTNSISLFFLLKSWCLKLFMFLRVLFKTPSFQQNENLWEFVGLIWLILPSLSIELWQD